MDLFLAVKPTILIADDTPANLTLLASLLQPTYTVKACTRGQKTLDIVAEQAPDLVLLDIEMPDLSGYEVCRRLKANPQTQEIPVIFLTSKTDAESEELGLTMGAVDYIMRPINPAILLSRVKAHLADAASAASLRIANQYLEVAVAARTGELTNLQEMTVLALASLAETRDTETGNHLRRTQHYMRALANHLQTHPRYADHLDDNMISLLFKCAPLHDIGKVGIPDRILLKNGRYTPEEFAIMKTHPMLGHDAIVRAQELSGQRMNFLEVAKEIVYSHHEKWDGSGYPQGLAGEAIPLSARLMAVADVYDALISHRIYKSGMNHERATQIITEGRGTHFDPDVVDAFVALGPAFEAISKRFADTDRDIQQKAEYLSYVL